METKNSEKIKILFLIIPIAVVLCGGCGEGRMKLKPIYDRAILGALIGGIVGYQSDEAGEGAALGAVILGTGEYLRQVDRFPDGKSPEPANKSSNAVKETYIIEIHNDNGSITPVELRKEGDIYIGPTGEQYESLPTEEDLKPIYGI